MFDSMNMHSPVVVALLAALLVVVLAGLFVAVRVVGQRVVDDKKPGSTDNHPDSRR